MRTFMRAGILGIVPATIAFSQSITSFSPAAASAGATVTVIGTGFSTTPANNIVRFGGGRATVTVATSESLHVTVPPTARFGPVTVTVPGSTKTAISKTPFGPTFPAGDLDAASIVLDQSLTPGGGPWEPTLIDLNADGKLDLFLTRTSGAMAMINTSTGGTIAFGAPSSVSTGSFTANRVLTEDFDADGTPEFVFLSSARVQIMHQVAPPGTPSFQSWKEFSNPDMTGGSWRLVRAEVQVGQSINALLLFLGEDTMESFPDNHLVWVPNYITNMRATDAVSQDFNGDGRPDLAIAYAGNPHIGVPGRVRVFLNSYNTSILAGPIGHNFTLAADFEIREPVYNNLLDPYGLAAADFDGDGAIDLAVSGNFDAYSSAGMVTVLVNAGGTGTRFVPVKNWFHYSRIERVVAADFDGDGKMDVGYQSQDDASIRVRRNTSPAGYMTFADPATITQQNGAQSLRVADLDGDGRPDLFWACENASGFKAVRNTSVPGSVTFSGASSFLHSIEFARSIDLGDLDGDGSPDVVATDPQDGQVHVLRNDVPAFAASQSTIELSTSPIAKNATTTATLQIRNVHGDPLSTTGLSVVFSLTGSGTSVGSFGTTTDLGNGAYSSIFTGTGVGMARSVTATINGKTLSSVLPAVTVAAGAVSEAQSVVTLSRSVVASGSTMTAMLQAKDANGDTLTTGGATVNFQLAGSGTSSGSFGAVRDSGNGKYYATFTGSTSGTANGVTATIGGTPITTTAPTVTVNAGPFSISTSVVSIPVTSIYRYDSTTVYLQVKDGSGNNVTTGGLSVLFEVFGGGTAYGYFLDPVDHQNGTYSARFVSTNTNNAVGVIVSIYNSSTTGYQMVNSFPPQIQISARPVSLSLSTVEWEGSLGSTIITGASGAFAVYARDDRGQPYTQNNITVAFTLANDGTSGGYALESVHYDGGGNYRMQWQATTPGSPRTLTASINGAALTSPSKSIAVTPWGPGGLYPGYFAAGVPIDTIFTWEAVSGANGYRVQLMADSLTGQVLLDTNGVTDTYVTVSGLLYYRPYAWRVMAMNSGVESGLWAGRTFTTVASRPGLKTPYNRQTQVGLPVSIGWHPVVGATSYRLQVATDTLFAFLAADETVADSSSLVVHGLAAGQRYFWRVYAIADGVQTAWSERWSFTTSSASLGGSRYYVTSTGDDSLTGTSWVSAFASVQRALELSSAGDEIWVAAGTYKPTTTEDRGISFVLKNGVGLYGGFAGTETAISQRDWLTNVTQLSGDIDSDGTLANNSYHVVTAHTLATAVLDGFVVSGGYAEGSNGGGILCQPGSPTLRNLTIQNCAASAKGGGMYVSGGSPTLTNVRFTSNSAGEAGGGLASMGGQPYLVQCTFTGNSAIDGGGMMHGSPFVSGSATLTLVEFRNNVSSHFGGGLYSTNGSTQLSNCLFSKNTASSFGGGFYHDGGGSPVVVNSTFGGNVADGGGMMFQNCAPIVKNSILWGNRQGATPNQVGLVLSTWTVSSSIVEGGIYGSGVVNYFAGSTSDGGGNIDADPLYVDLTSGDLSTQAGSAAIDSGAFSLVSTINDIAGQPRVVGGRIDLGAFEFQGTGVVHANSVTANDSTYAFGNTDLALTFSGIAPNRTLLVFAHRDTTGPQNPAFEDTSVTFVSPTRWVVARSGDSFGSAAFTIKNASSLPGVVNPAALVVFHRSTPDSGSFTALPTSYDGGTDELTATTGSFSEFAVGGGSDVLPVQLTHFAATAQQHSVTLTWSTATEVDNAGWEVERRAIYDLRLSSVDFQTIGFVEGAGTSTSAQEYTFIDRVRFDNRQSPIDNSTRIAYRLKQVDRSGSSRYSYEAEVEVGSVPREFTLAQNYPNPFNPTTTVEFTLPEDGRVRLRMYDLTGREVRTVVDEERRAGVLHREEVDGHDLGSGVYFVRLEFAGRMLVKKMVLMR